MNGVAGGGDFTYELLKLLQRFLDLYERHVVTLERGLDGEDEPEDTGITPEYVREQTAAMNRVAAVNEEKLKRDREWEAVEREHMRICERKYQELVEAGQAPPTLDGMMPGKRHH